MTRKEELFAVDGTVSPWHTEAAKAYFEKHLDNIYSQNPPYFHRQKKIVTNLVARVL